MHKNGRADLRLTKQIHNKINQFKGFDSGTKSIIGMFCRLARGNPQWPGVLDWFRKPKISWFKFLVDLEVKSTPAIRIDQFGFLKFLRCKNSGI
jgi:hypothetical protein